MLFNKYKVSVSSTSWCIHFKNCTESTSAQKRSCFGSSYEDPINSNDLNEENDEILMENYEELPEIYSDFKEIDSDEEINNEEIDSEDE